MKKMWYLCFGFLVILLLAAYSVYLAYSYHSVVPMFSLLMIIVFFLCWALLLGFDVVNSFFFFSIMYLGYALGGFYYSASGGYYGKFIEFYNVDSKYVEPLLLGSIIYAVIFYIGFCLSYFSKGRLFPKCSAGEKSFSELFGFESFLVRNYLFFIYPVLFSIIAYWLYVSIVAAGGLLNAVIYFQVFPHFIRESGLSIAPYVFYYACIYIWALCIVLSGKSIPVSYLLFSFFGIVLVLSTGRIAQAATYVFAQLVFFLLSRPRYYKAIAMLFVFVVVGGFMVHFARIASNYYYLGLSFDEMDLDLLRVVVGGGNVSDLQQLIIVLDVFSNESFLYGATFFDWFKNSIGKYLGFEPSSIGLLIQSKIVPEGSSSGAPTPGALGELHANFGYFSILFSLLIGLCFRFIDEFGRGGTSLIKKLVYSIFITHFVFLYPKVDTTMLVNFLWRALPALFVLLAMYLLYSLSKKISYENCPPHLSSPSL